MGIDGVHVSGDLNSIGSCSSSDFSNNRLIVSERQLGRMIGRSNLTIMRVLLKDSGHNIPAKNKFQGNLTCGGSMPV